jgi:TfoX/Sxy family transcriptional regulator of competence genes
MAWVKIPPEHHPSFLAAVPRDPRVTTLKMFGGIAAKANGQMFAGLFARSFVVKLAEADREEALRLDGAELFDPMGNGRIMRDTVFMPEDTFCDDRELRSWLRRGLDYTVTLPAKATPAAKAKPAAKAGPAAKAKPTAKATSAAKLDDRADKPARRDKPIGKARRSKA